MHQGDHSSRLCTKIRDPHIHAFYNAWTTPQLQLQSFPYLANSHVSENQEANHEDNFQPLYRFHLKKYIKVLNSYNRSENNQTTVSVYVTVV